MKYKHYAPNTKYILIYSKNKTKMINKMKKLENENSLIIINNNNNNNNINQFKNAIGYGTTLEDISQNIFTLLRQVDKENKDLIIIEGVKSEN